MSLRQEVPSPVYFPEKESQKESDGVLQLLYGRQVLPRAPELHRHTRHVYTRKSYSGLICEDTSSLQHETCTKLMEFNIYRLIVFFYCQNCIIVLFVYGVTKTTKKCIII